MIQPTSECKHEWKSESLAGRVQAGIWVSRESSRGWGDPLNWNGGPFRCHLCARSDLPRPPEPWPPPDHAALLGRTHVHAASCRSCSPHLRLSRGVSSSASLFWLLREHYFYFMHAHNICASPCSSVAQIKLYFLYLCILLWSWHLVQSLAHDKCLINVERRMDEWMDAWTGV